MEDEYAVGAMREVISDEDLLAYKAARQIRHETEYPEPDRQARLQHPDAQKAVDLAKRLHAAVTQSFATPT